MPFISCAPFCFGRPCRAARNTASFYAYPGADDPEVGTGRCSDNEYYDNIITDTPMGVSLKSADGNSITGQ